MSPGAQATAAAATATTAAMVSSMELDTNKSTATTDLIRETQIAGTV